VSEARVVDDVATTAPAGTADPRPPIWDRSASVAAWVFGVFVAGAALLLLFRLGRYHWFHGDEWDFLVDRDAGDIGDLVRAHNEHLTLLPILVYRALWQVFGVRTYLPYQVPVIAMHLTAAVLLRVVMRRAGVHPWIATAAAGVFVLFGPGEENIVWAFQITFTGSLVFGLAHLLLADHPGEIDQRDWIGLGFGVLGLLSSGLTPLFTGVVGVVVLVRRGWKPAAFNVLPLAAAYLVWWFAIGPHFIDVDRSPAVSDLTHFVWRAVSATFESLGAGSPILGVLVAVVLVVGLAVAYAPLRGRELVDTAVVPVSLLVAGVGFMAVSAYGRWWFGDIGDSSRYLHLLAAFTLPALAVAADALARTWRYGVPVATIAFVATIPYVAGQFDTNGVWNDAYFDARQELVASLGRSQFVDMVPRWVEPDLLASRITAGWLHDAREADRLPPIDDPEDADDPILRLRFGLVAIDAPPLRGNCAPLRGPTDLSLDEGDEVSIEAQGDDGLSIFNPRFTAQLLVDGTPAPGRVGYQPANGSRLRAMLDDLDVRIVPVPGAKLELCR
jgi:hypothetical protein